MKRLVYALLAAVLFVVPVGAQIRTIGGSSGGTCCSAATITPIDSIRFTGTTSSILGGTGSMTIQAGTGNSRALSLKTTDNAGNVRTPLQLIGDTLKFGAGWLETGNIKIALADGSAASPTHTFVNDPSFGMYYRGSGTTDSLGLSSRGVAFLKGIADTALIWSKAKAPSLTAASGTPNSICINATTKEITENAATSCVVSSRRFKRNIVTLQPAVASRIASQLRPVSFSYKDGGRQAIGLIAEEADSVDYRLASRDSKGQLNSVNYEQISVILLSVVQEQQKKFARMCAAGIKEAC